MNRRACVLFLVAIASVVGAGNVHAENWSGPEIGIQSGGAWGTSRGDLLHPGSVPYSFLPWGGLGGGHAGYDWRSGLWLLGVEGDAEAGAFAGFQDPARAVAVDNRLHFDASARARLGIVFNRVLVYGTGGLAVGDVNTRYSVGGLTWFPAQSFRVGWTMGAGAAYALTPHWEAGLEYRYTDLGSHSVSNAVFSDTNRFDFNAVRLTLTYRFSALP
jgi:outer membrane immunogenic protein